MVGDLRLPRPGVEETSVGDARALRGLVRRQVRENVLEALE